MSDLGPLPHHPEHSWVWTEIEKRTIDAERRRCHALGVAEGAARIERLEAEAEKLRSVMVAAAEEIQEHWEAHCDAEGYGPANLMRRLEEGIPAEYGYTAGAFAYSIERIKRLEAALRELVALKDLKATIGSHDTEAEDEYLRRKPAAWNAAREALKGEG